MTAGPETPETRVNAASAARRGLLQDDAKRCPDEETAGGGFAALLPAGLMLLAGLGGLTLASLLADGVAGQFVVVSPPWQPAVQVVASADGALLAGGGFSNVIVAASDRPGFADDLREAGAWLVFPAPRALGCGPADAAGASARQADARGQAGQTGALPVFQNSFHNKFHETEKQAGSF